MYRSDVHKRYQTDPAFRNLVDLFHNYIREANFTPTEIREAAMLAQIMYEELTLRPMILDDIRRGKP